MIRNLNK